MLHLIYPRNMSFYKSCANILIFFVASLCLTCAVSCPSFSSQCQEQMTSNGERNFTCQTSEFCLNETLESLPKDVIHLRVILPRFPLEDGSFSALGSLKSLAIVWSNPDKEMILHAHQNSFGSHVFGNLTQLEILRINIPTIEIENTAFLYLDNLREIDLSEIGFFSSQKFAALYNGSKMHERPLEVFRARQMSGVETAKDRVFLVKDIITLLDGSSIREIDVSYNRDLYLYPGLTQNLPHLEVLNIEGNNIRYIDSPDEASCCAIELFIHQKLKCVNINNLGAVGKEVDFFGKSFLRAGGLCLLRSPESETCVCETFTQFCGSYFPGGVNCSVLPVIKLDDITNFLPVSRDPYRYCDNFVRFPLPPNLEELRLSDSQFRFGKTGWTQRTICFKQNNLKKFDVSYVSFSLDTYSTRIYGFDNLTELNCAFSGWGYFFLDQQFLHSMAKLEVLNMTGTNIGVYMANDTNGEIFNKSTALRQLYLRQASISLIVANAFENLYNLEYLDLSGNQLSSIDFNIKGLVKLEYFDLSFNDFTKLSSDAMIDLDNLLVTIQGYNDKNGRLEVNMHNNEFVCDCHAIEFLTWTKTTKIRFSDGSNYLCSYKGQSKITMASVDVGEMTRGCNLAIIAGTSVGSVFLILFITSFLMYKFRWRLRLCFLKISHLTIKKDSKKFQYDGFVVYTDQDREWVHNTLLHELEQKRELKLCVHHRDFIPGHDIDEQIVRSVDSSRKTLLVLSRHFLESSWCQYEMNVARNKLQAEGKDVLLPVLLAELSPEELNENPPIKNLLREKTYLRWETSIDGQEYFWKKLTLGLKSSVKSRRKNSDATNTQMSPNGIHAGTTNVETANYGTLNA